MGTSPASTRQQMQDSRRPGAEHAPATDPVDAARQAIWRLFEQGQIDEHSATEALLAVDVGLRRMRSPQRDAHKREDGDRVDPGK